MSRRNKDPSEMVAQELWAEKARLLDRISELSSPLGIDEMGDSERISRNCGKVIAFRRRLESISEEMESRGEYAPDQNTIRRRHLSGLLKTVSWMALDDGPCMRGPGGGKVTRIDLAESEVTVDGETSKVPFADLRRLFSRMPDISDWEPEYRDSSILDGSCWELTAGFADSGPELRWYGVNQYPYSFLEVRKVFEDARELKIRADADSLRMSDPDRYRGCLVGGALGDALGFPVEFLSLDDIRSKYGPDGISGLQTRGGCALISDDTQMSMFTAYSIPFMITRQFTYGIAARPSDYAFAFYREWMCMQRYLNPDDIGEPRTWLYRIPELRSRRAPGMTCISDICGHKHAAKRDVPRNDSKGCGGVMRTAALGLNPFHEAFSVDNLRRSIWLGADNAASTHGNVMGWVPAAMLSGMINCIVCGDMGLRDAILTTYLIARDELLPHMADVDDMGHRLLQAYDLARSEEGSDADLIAGLGEGWVADEALAMAVFACARHPDDIMGTLVCAVNHDGDSDSVGAIAGNLMGAMMGYRRICEQIDVSRIECLDVLLRLADDVWMGYVDEDDEGHEEWIRKYVYGEVPSDIAANHPGEDRPDLQ